jgi:perosamine synthetase
MIRLSPPFVGEEEKLAVLAVLESGMLISGPVVRQLEAAFAEKVSGTEHAVAVANGTAALHLALLAHGIGPGDEVITTAFSFQATANMVLAVGARPVFVDVDENGNIDVSQVEAAITPRTKALLPVHLYGRLCEVEAFAAIAERHGLVVIEDAAQAHAARRKGRAAGAFGTGCFSFYATKNMMSGEGGMITTSDASLAERLRRLRARGEAARYQSIELGFNYRLTDFAAAIALAQLERLEGFNAVRRRNAAHLSSGLRGVGTPGEPDEPESHVWHQYTVRVPQGRDHLQAYLREQGIESAVYYPTPIPAQPLYLGLGYDGEYPMAARLAAEVLSLPVHPGLSEADLDRIVTHVNDWTATSCLDTE